MYLGSKRLCAHGDAIPEIFRGVIVSWNPSDGMGGMLSVLSGMQGRLGVSDKGYVLLFGRSTWGKAAGVALTEIIVLLIDYERERSHMLNIDRRYRSVIWDQVNWTAESPIRQCLVDEYGDEQDDTAQWPHGAQIR
jgi:hypothetical protein